MCYNHRYQFFLQVKQDVVLGRLPVSSTVACELAAFVLQCKFSYKDIVINFVLLTWTFLFFVNHIV